MIRLFALLLTPSICLGFWASFSSAALANEQFLELPQKKTSFIASGFFAPNEELPQKALSVYRSALPGAYVAVGTERGFIGAANSPNVTHLVLVDRDPGTVFYNRINILLLKSSKDRKHYFDLRLNPTPFEWGRAAREAGLTESEIALLVASVHEWKEMVVENKSFKNFHYLPSEDVAFNSHRHFSGVNYLFYDEPFRKIQRMAKDGRIVTGCINLEIQKEIVLLVDQLSSKGIALSVLDLSNAWWPRYIKKSAFTEVLQQFSRVAGKESVLLMTGYSLAAKLGNASGEMTRHPWSYHGYTFKRIRSYGSFKRFADSLGWHWNMSLGQSTKINPGLIASGGECISGLLSLLVHGSER